MKTPPDPLRQATESRRLGRLAEARAIYAQALQRAPGHVEILRQWGTLEMQMGQPMTAAQMLSQALALKPEIPELYYEMGSALAMLGRADEAIAHFNEAIRLRPRYPEVYIGLGRLALMGQQSESAESHFAKAVSQKPDNGEALYGLGLAQISQGKWVEAERSLFKASKQAPKHPIARYNLAKAQRENGKFTESAASYREAVKLAPNNHDAFNNLGSVLNDLGKFDEAVTVLHQALKLRPDWSEALYNLGLALKGAKQPLESRAALERAIALKPNFPEALSTLGNLLKDQGLLDEAISLYQQALSFSPGYADAVGNLGLAYKASGNIDEALPLLRHAVMLDPNEHDLRNNLGLVLLSRGELAEGWVEYEHRWQSRNRPISRPFSQTRWAGEDLAGKKLLLWGEQGVGDELLYAQQIPDLLAKGAEIILETDKRLVPLFARSFPEITVLAKQDPPGKITKSADFQSPLGSLGVWLRNDFAAFANNRPYLKANAELTAALREKYLAGDTVRLVGISWRSKNERTANFKSSPLLDWAPLLRQPGIRFVNLQYGDCAADLAEIKAKLGIEIINDLSIDPLADMDGFASQVAALDQIISVSNTTVHVAGALGRPVWTLLSKGQGLLWYWFEEREDSPWYPSMRFFRQRKESDWSELLARVAGEAAQS
jgi:tetratricopeptide (TPR) repeat protein